MLNFFKADNGSTMGLDILTSTWYRDRTQSKPDYLQNFYYETDDWFLFSGLYDASTNFENYKTWVKSNSPTGAGSLTEDGSDELDPSVLSEIRNTIDEYDGLIWASGLMNAELNDQRAEILTACTIEQSFVLQYMPCVGASDIGVAFMAAPVGRMSDLVGSFDIWTDSEFLGSIITDP
jgi:hypothetical protein